MPERKLFTKILFFILLLGFCLRMVGVKPGYAPTHPDEGITYSTAIEMILKTTLDPFSVNYRFQYPGLMIYLDVLLFSVFFIPVGFILAVFSHPDIFFSHLGQPGMFITSYVVGYREVNALFWGREITALIGFLGIPIIYFIGKEFFNKYVGLLAALFLAVNFRHVVSSHMSLVDAPNSTFALLSLLLSIYVWKKPTRLNYILAGIGIGLSLSGKFYFFSILPLLLIHFLVVLKRSNFKEKLKAVFSYNIILAGFTAAIIFILFNPFLIFHLGLSIKQHELNNLRYGMGTNVLNIGPVWYLWEIGYGQAFSILFILGLLIALLNKKYWIKAVLLLFFIVPPCYLLLYYSSGGGYTRNFTSIVPFACLFSALGLYCIVSFVLLTLRIRSVLLITATLFLVGLLVSIEQLKYSAITAYTLSQTWDVECIQNKTGNLFKGNIKVARTPNVPSVSDTRVQYFPHGNTNGHKTPYSLRELQDENTNYLVTNSDLASVPFNYWINSGTRFWGMPVDFLDNTFEGLALKELNRYEIAACKKPWPSIDDNYIVMKIPSNVKSDTTTNMVSINKTIVVSEGSPPSWPKQTPLSDFIPVESGKRYIITAQVKSEKPLLQFQRDGFLRADFYTSKNMSKKRGQIVAISPRYFGDISWKTLQVSQVVPKGVHFLKVTFQAEDYTTALSVKDVQISVPIGKPTQEEIITANKKEIDNYLLYPTYTM